MINHSNREPLSANCVIRAALSAELISADDVINRGVDVEQVGRSHSVFKLSLAGEPLAFIKSFGETRGETDGNIARERAIIELARSRQPVKELVAAEQKWKPNGMELATKPVIGKSAWEVDKPGGGSLSVEQAWTELCAGVLTRLSNFHRATRDIAENNGKDYPALANQVPWALKLFNGDTPKELWQTPTISSLLSDASQTPALVGGIRCARRLWRPMCVIHADLKHDNIVLNDTKAIIIDWEMARVGDPAWDLAGLCSRFLLIASHGNGWSDLEHRCIALLVSIYASQSGLDRVILTRRVLQYIGAWTFMAAIQHQSTLNSNELSKSSASMLQKSIATFQQAQVIEEHILRHIDLGKT
ncbi:aminoglycoside phosphotransferase family protein [Arenicella sp. 4NH20-0111]|uniref:aminoglycoside phosphotransferase family protein n=1 Tax=Arenicella sp. 4NH20-0111 TaxID=3127648 RepID=UPI00333E5391